MLAACLAGHSSPFIPDLTSIVHSCPLHFVDPIPRIIERCPNYALEPIPRPLDCDPS